MTTTIKTTSIAVDSGGSKKERQVAAATTFSPLTITWTTAEPTTGDALTIADGATPTVAELGSFAACITPKVNALLAACKAHGIIAE